LSNANKALLVLGAIGAILYSVVRWLIPWIGISGRDYLALAFIAYVLMTLGVLVFYRKSGNPLHIVTALVMLVHTVPFHLLHMLWVIDPVLFPWVGPTSIWREELWGPILALVWLLLAVSVLMMREEYGRIADISAVVFVIWSVLTILDKVLGIIWPLFLTDITLYFRTIVGVFAFIMFLYAALKES
jgi:hypothetical protein